MASDEEKKRQNALKNFEGLLDRVDGMLESATGGQPIDFDIFSKLLDAVKENSSIMRQVLRDHAAVKSSLVEILRFMEEHA